MVRFTFAVFGDVQVDRTLEGISDRVVDMRPAWSELQRRFLIVESRQFRSQGGFSGGWSPLSPRYAAWKARRYPGKTILRRTDELFRSLTEGPDIAILEPDHMILGTSVDYGGYHQDGSGRLPRRRPVELPDWERREWVKVIQSFIGTGSVTGVRGVARPENRAGFRLS